MSKPRDAGSSAIGEPNAFSAAVNTVVEFRLAAIRGERFPQRTPPTFVASRCLPVAAKSLVNLVDILMTADAEVLCPCLVVAALSALSAGLPVSLAECWLLVWSVSSPAGGGGW